MPSTNPRIQVRVKPHQYAIIKRLAAINGTSQGAVLAGLFEAVEPMMERAVVLAEAARALPEEARATLRDAAEKAERASLPHVHAVTRQWDLLVGDVARAEREAAAAPEDGGPRPAGGTGRGRRPRKAGNPRPVITGVTRSRKGGG